MDHQLDIAILVPKEDELRAVQWALGTEFHKSDGVVIGSRPYYRHSLADKSGHSLSIAVVFLNDQGNSVSSSVTQDVITSLRPAVFFLTGTAAGREGEVTIGQVLVSSLIVDAQEWRLEEDSQPRIKHHEPTRSILTDAERFVGSSFDRDRWLGKLMRIRRDLYRPASPPLDLWNQPTVGAKVSIMAASNYLHLAPALLKRLWQVDKRIKTIDMESGGFGQVCKESQVPWLVIRGVSDYGTPESKREEYRVASAAAAAAFLRMFIERGLVESHPRALRVPVSEKHELSATSLYTQYRIGTAVREGIHKKLGITFSQTELGESLTLADVESLCVSKGADATKARRVLWTLREESFTRKYLSYRYDNDLRGIIPTWAAEFHKILGDFALDLATSTVLVVGAGNGLELHDICGAAKAVIGVDISRKCLQRAKHEFPALRSVHNAAEDLRAVDTSSVDLYVSLRTCQSSLFDMNLSLREAHRVLRSRGLAIISIANGFVDIDAGQKKVVRGLLVRGTTNVVDRGSPRRLAEQAVVRLENLGFNDVGYESSKTDIYVWAQKP